MIKNLIKIKCIIASCIILFYLSCNYSPRQIQLSGFTMGTTYNIKMIPSKEDYYNTDVIKQKVDSLLIGINQQMSTYLFDSEITNFNNFESSDLFAVSDYFPFVVKRALYWAELTNGAFDITLVPLLYLWGFGPGQEGDSIEVFPSDSIIEKRRVHMGYKKLIVNNNYLQKKDPYIKIDLNAIAKGFGVDVIFSFLESIGMQNIMVEIGGEVRCKGKNRKNDPWTIAVETPTEKTEIKSINWAIHLENNAMATSGDYRNYYEVDGIRYSHEIDPRTGYPAQTGIASATVTAPNCMDADALATAIIIMGQIEGLKLIEKLENVEAFIILRDGKDKYRSIKSSGMKISAL